MKYKESNFNIKKNLQYMNILTAVNLNYLNPLSVMLYSLAVHNHVCINVYILHFGILSNSQEIFKKQVNRWKRPIKIHFLKIDYEDFRNMPVLDRCRMEANLRLILLKVLPSHMDKILWLDADIIVKGNIYKLYLYPDHGQYAMVCEDMLPKRDKYELISKIGMSMNERYFNSGVILFYLKNIQKDFKEIDFLQWMYEHREMLEYPDQDTLNNCLKGKLCWAKPEIYNLQLSWLYKKDTALKLINKSRIIHYNMPKKPWDDGYSREGEGLFWKYAIKVYGIKKFLIHYIKKYIKIVKGNMVSICWWSEFGKD